ncbi:WD40 repeat domain-containing protein [Nocardia takedensis]
MPNPEGQRHIHTHSAVQPPEQRRIGRRRLLIGAAIATPVTAATAAGITAFTSASPAGSARLSGTLDAVLTGHTTDVLSVAFSPDGTVLATGSSDRTIRLWDIGTHQQIGEPLTGQTNSVTAVAFSPDGTVLAAGGHKQMVRLWDTAGRRQLGEP